jgi:hypothetical protein
MSKEKMKFPKVPGDTPREKFINLVGHVFSVGKMQGKGKNRRARKRK